MLDKFNKKNCNVVNTPIVIVLKLTREGEGKLIDPTLFRSLIGSLRYLLITRLEIVYSVGLLSRYMEKPKESHWLVAKRVLRYIKGTMDLVFYIHIIMMPHYTDIQIMIGEVIKMKGKAQPNMFLSWIKSFHLDVQKAEYCSSVNMWSQIYGNILFYLWSNMIEEFIKWIWSSTRRIHNYLCG